MLSFSYSFYAAPLLSFSNSEIKLLASSLKIIFFYMIAIAGSAF